MSAFCGKCGEKLKKSNKFCGNCSASADQSQRSRKAATDPRPLLLNPTKLAVMYILTFGLYAIRWFYRQWRFVKLRDKSRIFPFGLALVNICTAGLLFYRLDISRRLPKTVAYPLLLCAVVLPGKLALVSLLAVVPLYQVQAEINQRYPDAIHTRFSKRMMVLALIGACVWGVLIWYLFRG